MPIGLFIDAAYVYKSFGGDVASKINYKKLRDYLEAELKDTVDEGYFFNADDDPPRSKQLHNALSYPPPDGPGLRVKVYWLQRKALFWPKRFGGQPVIHPEDDTLQYELTTQKAVDVGLVYHMTRSHLKRGWDKLVLAAGDADFHEPIQNLVEADNVDLYIVGAMKSISQELRPYAKRIFEIDQEPLFSQLKL